MVKPVWEESTETLPAPLSRFTLFLRDDQDAAERGRRLESIRNQFRQLDAPLLIFLRNIERIGVTFYDKGVQPEWAVDFKKRSDAEDKRRMLLETSHPGIDSPEAASPSGRIYHVTRHRAQNLARGENRTLTEAEELTKSNASSEIVLAFPLTATSEPIVEPQKVFAFLPMKQAGFNVSISARTPLFLFYQIGAADLGRPAVSYPSRLCDPGQRRRCRDGFGEK